MNLIKKHSLIYLRTKKVDQQPLKGATKFIEGFLEVLSQHDADFGLIKADMIKTSYPFINSIRIDLKNKVTKINNEPDKVKSEQNKDEKEEEDQE